MGEEIKNVDCSRFGNMLYLEIQKGKENTNTEGFHQLIGGTISSMERLMMATKRCCRLTSNWTYFADSWFSGVKVSDEAMDMGVDYWVPVKMSHKGFWQTTLEKLTKEWPVGSYIVMKSNPRVPGDRPLMAIWYKYYSRKVLGFISTEGAGSTEPGDPYLSCCLGKFSNVSFIPVVCTCFLGRYLNACNTIGNHNRMCMSNLFLEKYCLTQSGYLDLQLQWHWVWR